MSRPKRALIAGAGIAGLSAAIAFRRPYWRELGFPNCARALAAWAWIREQCRQQEAAKLFGPYAIKGEQYAEPVKPGRRK